MNKLDKILKRKAFLELRIRQERNKIKKYKYKIERCYQQIAGLEGGIKSLDIIWEKENVQQE